MNEPARFNRTRKFGIELECYGVSQDEVAAALTAADVTCRVESYNHITRRHWKIVSDASVGGECAFELVSPPLRGEAGLEKVRKVCEVLNTLGVRVNRSCGFHVHHDAGDLSVDNLKDVARLAFKYEAVTDYFVSPSRRGGRYAHGFLTGTARGYRFRRAEGENGNVIGLQTALRSVRGKNALAHEFQGGRFTVVNFQALMVHGTVEFRQHQGTTEADKVISWIIWTQWLLERAKRGRVTLRKRLEGRWATATQLFRLADWYNLDDELVEKAKKYLTKRFKKFKRLAEEVAQPRTNEGTERELGGVEIGNIITGPATSGRVTFRMGRTRTRTP